MSYFITNFFQFAGEKIVKISEHLVKLETKWLIVSYTPFALDCCPQRCITHQISKIISVWQTKTVTDCCYVNRQISVSLLATNIKLLYAQTSSDLLTDRLMLSVTDQLLIMYGILLQHVLLCCSSCVQSITEVFTWLV